VVRRPAALLCRPEDEPELLAHPLLTDELGQSLRSQRSLDDGVVAFDVRRHDLVLARLRHDVAFARLRHDVAFARLRHDVAFARLRHDVAFARLRHDLVLLGWLVHARLSSWRLARSSAATSGASPTASAASASGPTAASASSTSRAPQPRPLSAARS